MRVLITGGAGFIGSHLCEFLLKEGHEVICLDNMTSGTNSNLEDFFYHENFTFHEHDVTKYIHIHGELDWVLHLASLASPVFYQDYPIKTLKVGALGTHKTLGLAKAKNAKYLFASTSEVYGDPEVHPQPEDYWGNVNPVGARSCYDESKRYGEAITMAYHNKHDIDTRIARIFNTYGPRMRPDDGRVIPTFIIQALNNEDLTIYGDGTQTRSFCYIDDLIKGIWKLMNTQINEPINLGNPDEISIKELAEKIIDLTDSESGKTYEPLPEDDPEKRKPDIAKAEKQLEWEPKIGLREGLKSTIDYFERVKV
ncbi:hypothetical protein AKJ52_00775 [candidate division MSBL1 archaeon SCGC-AAA382C18]|uniref:UDP-glucuronate decarboxylase n=1 Tax=candidate division MSBL1 archaeon SCGC-AAA382C18 TaxID=1698281 RepID=A0A133VL78_9EURY|nr:hypothetical protein AKJ52_00775 [candidate division MSBL1 archaeon SCGC-AAA382C18]